MVTLLSRCVKLRRDRRVERSAATQSLPPTAGLAGISQVMSLVICTPPDARGSILRDCNHLWRVGATHRETGANKGSICRYDLLGSLLTCSAPVGCVCFGKTNPFCGALP